MFCFLQSPSEDDRVLKWEDLQGFWDMIFIQINEIDSMFTDIEISRNNNWQELALPVSHLKLKYMYIEIYLTQKSYAI